MDKQVNVYICQGALVPWRITQLGRGRREEEVAILNGPGEGLAEEGPRAEIWAGVEGAVQAWGERTAGRRNGESTVLTRR